MIHHDHTRLATDNEPSKQSIRCKKVSLPLISTRLGIKMPLIKDENAKSTSAGHRLRKDLRQGLARSYA